MRALAFTLREMGNQQRVWNRKVTEPGLCLEKVAVRRAESRGV